MLKESAVQIFNKCCKQALPGAKVKEVISIAESHLTIKTKNETKSFPLCSESKVYIVSFGKASLKMTKAAEESLQSYFTRGIVIAPEGQTALPLQSKVYFAGLHNLPNDKSLLSTTKVLEFLDEVDDSNAYILFLISGGGSALFCLPDEITLSEKLSTIKLLVSHGSSIDQLNVVRQYLSKVKGGKTLEHVMKSQVISLIMSDIIGDPIHLIASGPTVRPAADSITSPLDILNKLSLSISQLSTAVQNKLLKSPSSVSAGKVSNHIIINNDIVLESMRNELEKLGIKSLIISNKLCGDATLKGKEFAQIIRSKNLKTLLYDFYKYQGSIPTGRMALIFGGETTVKLKGNGCGGRNQEMVLSCLKELKSSPSFDATFLFMSAGTDGQDGPNDAAGAMITEKDLIYTTLEDCLSFLSNSDSYNFWKGFKNGECHIITGLTGTNVMDVQLLVLEN